MPRSARLAALLLALIACASSGSRADAFPAAGGGAGTQVYLRVNQVGYPSGGPKRAYLMSSTAQPGATFTVRDASDAVVLTANAGADLGAWSTKFGYVYPLDFDAVSVPGTYTVAVGGTSSLPFTIGSGAGVYAAAIGNALSFYQAERDGPDWVAGPLRTGPAHLNDEHAMTYTTPAVNKNGGFRGDLSPLGHRIDASGGWWDAGDYLKFLQTESYTDVVLWSGVRDLPGQLGAGAATDFTPEAAFGARWLLNMWDGKTSTLYYQVGIGTGNAALIGDHDIWRLAEGDDRYATGDPSAKYIRHRPAFRAGAPGSKISPNLAGRDAAALALCAQVLHDSDPGLAGRCLKAAKQIYALADTNPQGQLLTVIPYDFYPESEWRDDLELGAAELARATTGTRSQAYLADAAHWARAYIDSTSDAQDTLNLYDVAGLAHYELARAMDAAGDPANLEVTRADLVADLEKQLTNAEQLGAQDPFGFGFAWAQWDTASHGFGLSVTASELDALTGTHDHAAEAGRWLANVLGANAWGVSLAVGDGTVFPHCMQHQGANILGSLDGSPPILAGAVVEGPNSAAASGQLTGMRACPADGIDVYKPFNSRAVFEDNVESYSTVEPAIDLTATSPLAFAWQAAGS